MRGETVDSTAKNGLEGSQHPRVVFTAVKVVEGICEGEIADDVEGEEVEPRNDVKNFSCRGLLAQLGEKQVHIFLYDGLLFVHALGAKCVIQLAPEPLVVLVIPADEALGVTREVPSGLLQPLSLSGAVLEDLWPANGPVDREVVRRDSHDGPVLSMQVSALSHEGSCHVDTPLKGQVGGRVELGPRIFRQRVDS